MNISRYVNIDKFVNIQYIFFTSPLGIQLIISATPNVEITSPGRRASGFFNPCNWGNVCPTDSDFLAYLIPYKFHQFLFSK